MNWEKNDPLPYFDAFSMWADGDQSQTIPEKEMG